MPVSQINPNFPAKGGSASGGKAQMSKFSTKYELFTKKRKFRSFVFISYFVVFATLITYFSLPTTNIAVAAYSLDEAARKLAEGSPIDSPEKIFEILGRIVSWTYTIFFIVAVFFILVAAYNFLFARGDPEKIKSARSQILWAAVAIAIALISVGAAQIIKTFLNPGA